MAATDEKRKTLNNQKADILDARVIANYGDPGLDEDYHFDILSKFVVVMIESIDRVLTRDKWFKMLAIVKRPEHLWIKPEGGIASNPTSQKRSDPVGNVNVGLASGYSVSAISRMNQPYTLGETIKIRKLPKPLTYSDDAVFQSAFTNWDSNVRNYEAWHSEGATLPYFAGNNNKISALRQKTILPIQIPSQFYNFVLNKYQYEAMMLNANASNSVTNLTQIFDGTWGGVSMVYSANGGYVFRNSDTINIASIEYEDVNFGNKQRTASSECIPLVVATPNSFPTPKVRSTGTISYNPTYSTIVKSN